MLVAKAFDTQEKLYKATDIMQILEECVSDKEFYPICKRLAEIPSAVVRCKDCKHFMPYTGEEALIVPYEDTDGWCHQGYPRAMDFFCADGERKTE